MTAKRELRIGSVITVAFTVSEVVRDTEGNVHHFENLGKHEMGCPTQVYDSLKEELAKRIKESYG